MEQSKMNEGTAWRWTVVACTALVCLTIAACCWFFQLREPPPYTFHFVDGPGLLSFNTKTGEVRHIGPVDDSKPTK